MSTAQTVQRPVNTGNTYVFWFILLIMLRVLNPNFQKHVSHMKNASIVPSFRVEGRYNFINTYSGYKYHDWVLFSTTTKDGRRTSFGILGFVI